MQMESLLLWTILTVLTLLHQSSSTNGQTCNKNTPLVLNARAEVGTPLLSPAFLAANPSNLECAWTITAAAGHVVMMKFTKLTLTSSNDFLKLYDGDAVNNPMEDNIIGYYNLTDLPPDMFSSGTSMHLVFSRNSAAAEGQQFKLTYTAVKPRPDPTICSPFNKKTANKNIILPTSVNEGTFQSPLYPNPYPSNIECTWTIQGTFEIFFDDFRLEGDAKSGCLGNADIFQVNRTLLKTTAVPSPRYVGNTTVIPTVLPYTVNTFCGQSSPHVHLDSPGGYRSITFKSNLNNKVYTGFKASWRRLTDLCSAFNSKDQNWNLRVPSSSGRGRITNPYLQGDWPSSDVACRWQITVPEGSNIKLKFSEYLVYKYDDSREFRCFASAVSIYDGDFSDKRIERYLCGNRSTADFQSTGRFITIVYEGRTAFRSKFEIKWERVDEASDNTGMIVGIVIGCVILIGIVAVVTWYFVRRHGRVAKTRGSQTVEDAAIET